ncbi:hypothetical protein [Elioraea sp.]|uniref:hypothetical protein n=1 Tax=Elioraea sp. TaxID=2185103 RepID=UPI00307DE06E
MNLTASEARALDVLRGLVAGRTDGAAIEHLNAALIAADVSSARDPASARRVARRLRAGLRGKGAIAERDGRVFLAEPCARSEAAPQPRARVKEAPRMNNTVVRPDTASTPRAIIAAGDAPPSRVEQIAEALRIRAMLAPAVLPAGPGWPAPPSFGVREPALLEAIGLAKVLPHFDLNRERVPRGDWAAHQREAAALIERAIAAGAIGAGAGWFWHRDHVSGPPLPVGAPVPPFDALAVYQFLREHRVGGVAGRVSGPGHQVAYEATAAGWVRAHPHRRPIEAPAALAEAGVVW